MVHRIPSLLLCHKIISFMQLSFISFARKANACRGGYKVVIKARATVRPYRTPPRCAYRWSESIANRVPSTIRFKQLKGIFRSSWKNFVLGFISAIEVSLLLYYLTFIFPESYFPFHTVPVDRKVITLPNS